MNNFLLLLGGSTLTMAIYIISKTETQTAAEQGFGARLARWGRKQRVGATGTLMKGGLEHGLGKVTGSSLVSGKGLLDEASAAVKDTAGKVAEALGEPPRSH